MHVFLKKDSPVFNELISIIFLIHHPFRFILIQTSLTTPSSRQNAKRIKMHCINDICIGLIANMFMNSIRLDTHLHSFRNWKMRNLVKPRDSLAKKARIQIAVGFSLMCIQIRGVNLPPLTTNATKRSRCYVMDHVLCPPVCDEISYDCQNPT